MKVFRGAALGACALFVAACQVARPREVTQVEKAAIADSLKRMVMAAYDLSKPDAVRRLMSLYPDSGRVISASGGQLSTSRDTLEAGIRAFWQNVGQNMRDPRLEWGAMLVDVLGPDAAVMTATYRVPHTTPRGQYHEIGGAWTAVFARRGGRWVVLQEHLSDAPPHRM